jgi:glycosyltransferase involved in cell wall biosynthesis
LLTAVMVILVAPVLVLRLLGPIARWRRRRLRSLWSGSPVPTLPLKAAAERRLGVDARTLVYTTSYLADRFDYNLERWRARPLAGPLAACAVFLWACLRFDRLHFYCDQGLLPQFQPRQFNPWELAFYRFLGKQVFCWTYGADVRTRERTLALGEFNCCSACPEPGRFCVCDDRAGRENMRRLARETTGVVAMGDMIEYATDCVSDVFYWPVDLANGRYAPRYPSASGNGPVRVVHATNHRFFKGSDFIIDAVETLRSEGVSVELVLVEGVPNDEALEIYRTADIIFDQCVSGFHGYFSHEAMALGKPVVCFIRYPDRYLLDPEECPIVNTTPSELVSTLRRLIGDRALLRELGERGRRYIEEHHTPEAFGERLKGLYAERGVDP